MPFFSVIIPTYNRADIIKETILSVKNQQFTDWECIVVDDGSTDETRDVVGEMADADSRIVYVHQKNAERSAARNRGISLAKGDYLCFLDSDDYYLNSHLTKLYNNIVKGNQPEALLFTNHIVNKFGQTEIVEVPPMEENVAKYLFEHPVIPARVCISKRILDLEKFDEDITIVEDTILWVRISQQYDIIHIDEPSVVYRLHDDNSINIKNNSSQRRLEGLLLCFQRYPEVKASLSKSYVKKLMGDTYFGLARSNIYKHQSIKAIINLLKSIAFLGIHNQLKHKAYLIVLLLFNRPIKQYQQ